MKDLNGLDKQRTWRVAAKVKRWEAGKAFREMFAHAEELEVELNQQKREMHRLAEKLNESELRADSWCAQANRMQVRCAKLELDKSKLSAAMKEDA